MEKVQWIDLFESELDRASTVRLAGNEGQARVCARRAVGIMLGEYFFQQRIDVAIESAHGRIQRLLGQDNLPGEVKSIVQHFLLRVTPDHTLPVDIDLIAEARVLARILLKYHS
jgi:hypothetical protein